MKKYFIWCRLIKKIVFIHLPKRFTGETCWNLFLSSTLFIVGSGSANMTLIQPDSDPLSCALKQDDLRDYVHILSYQCSHANCPHKSSDASSIPALTAVSAGVGVPRTEPLAQRRQELHTVRKFNRWRYCFALCDEIFYHFSLFD